MGITIIIADKIKLCQISFFLGHLAEFVSLGIVFMRTNFQGL